MQPSFLKKKKLENQEVLWYDLGEVKGMLKKPICQEALKLIACITMLIDHIGVLLLPGWYWLPIIGRLSFPIYCFLLAEGIAHTKSPAKYALRMLICAVIAEPIYDFAFYGGLTFAYQSVMVSLLLGCCMLWALQRYPNWMLRGCAVLAVCVLAQLLHVSYGWRGILLMAAFGLSREQNMGWLLQLISTGLIFWSMGSARAPLLGIPIQLFGVLGMVPIWFYSGKKLSRSRVLQWSFYLFYPMHLLILFLIVRLL